MLLACNKTHDYYGPEEALDGDALALVRALARKGGALVCQVGQKLLHGDGKAVVVMGVLHQRSSRTGNEKSAVLVVCFDLEHLKVQTRIKHSHFFCSAHAFFRLRPRNLTTNIRR